MSTLQSRHFTHKSLKRRKASPPPAVPAGRVREMLLEIAFALHATRVVGRKDRPVAEK